ncbi:hypothetical protein BCR34DRAFT_564736 [Clohesyomyces aquaticus]|uniref:RBR-type E3 ubiquitin transferase n=1 Tax=Clohesyomyces aquaticus TaxID=1231657 RepID=A0A1Y1ZNL7_9PLEO|nr:hypothetical protein BCR34DRAFT_564736 [Clohesyomyces aquaticus]
MNDEDFSAWTTCWKANLYFYREAPGPLTCISCSSTQDASDGNMHSSFWMEATRCLAGHRQVSATETSEDTNLGVCSTCENDFVFDIVTGKKVCRREGCRRLVRVNESEVKIRIGNADGVLDAFLTLIKKCKIYDCDICGSEIIYQGPASQALKPPTPGCDHDRRVCDPCLKAMFEPAIQGGRIEGLLCPDPECKKSIPGETVRANVSPEVFKLYARKMTQKKLAEKPNFRWCSCGHGQLHSAGESNPEWICLSCKKRHCFICRETACTHLQQLDTQKKKDKATMKHAASQHFLKTKEERDKQRKLREMDAETKKEEARISKKCPNAACRIRMYKDGGCAHMTCKKCGANFCWSCKVMWKNGTALHLNTCVVGTTTTVMKVNLDTGGYGEGWDVDPGYDNSLDGRLWLQASDM